MYTNTSRVLTAFSDLEHDGDQTFLSNRDVLAYLNRYADMFGLRARIRFGRQVNHVSRIDTRWRVTHDGGEEPFDRVVLASGRFRSPQSPTFLASRRSPAPQARCRRSTIGERIPTWVSAFWWRAARSAPGHRHGTRTTRRHARRRHPAKATLCPSEIRRRRPVRPPDLHAIRRLGE